MAKGIGKVIIVGGGPVGFLTALMLSKSGIGVEVLEANNSIDPRPRGVAYGPSAVRVLRLAGIIDKVRKKGIGVKDMCWRELGGKYITGMTGMDDPDYLDRFVVLPVHLLAELIFEEVKDSANVKIHWGSRFTGLVQHDEGVTVTFITERQDQQESLIGDFVVGCDGARSEVRKSLFGSSFPGRTWPVQIVATNIRYDGFDKYGWSDVQWVIHPEHWCIACRLDDQGTWRFAYGEPAGMTESQMKERQPTRFEILLPGNPREGDYELLRWNPFIMHQRCAERMRVGRVLLAGDAAHLCNPMGGLGLTGGIADVGSLVECLRGIHSGLAGMDILDIYDEKRREIYWKVVDPLSTQNLERLFLDGSNVLGEDAGLQFIKSMSEDPVAAKSLQKSQDVLTVDMTEFYDSQVPSNSCKI